MDPRADASRGQAAAEIAGLVGLVETIMWVVPFTSRPTTAFLGLVGLIVSLLVVCHLRDSVPRQSIGFRLDNFLAVLKVYGPPFGVAVALMVCVGLAAGSLRFGSKFVTMLWSVPAWALLQQYMLLGFAHRRFRLLLGPGRPSVVATGAMFAVLHLPNPTLTVVCGAAGLLWAWQYEREPNLLANAVTHTIGSAFLANTLPSAVLKNMVVGYNYFLR